MHLRPGVREFLRDTAQFADLYGFTAAARCYAEVAFQQLDPDASLFKQIWYRDDCTEFSFKHRGNMNVAYGKDLSRVFAQDYVPERTCLVDNNPMSFTLQPSNGILIESFYDDPDDSELSGVHRLLRSLDKEIDIRPVLKDMFRLEETLPKPISRPPSRPPRRK